MRLVAILSWGSMISVKKWLERVSSLSIGYALFGRMLWVLVYLMFFLICFMWYFAVAMEGVSCFISSTVGLGQVVKWPFLVAWSKVFFTGIKRAVWYHLDIYGLFLASRALSDAGCFWIGVPVGLLVRLTCHIPDVDDMLPSITVSPFLTTLI